jgi:membrane protease subunit HflK
VRIETQRVLQETLDRYQAGIQITEFNFIDVNVPAQVREAYSDVIRAREDRERYIEEARVHANSVVPEARGQAARIIQEAEGYKAATVAVATGEARRFSLLLDAYRQAPAITRKRLYLQTMENVFARSRKVLLDADNSGNVLYLPLDQLSGEANAGRALMPPLVTPDHGPSADQQSQGRSSRREGRQ